MKKRIEEIRKDLNRLVMEEEWNLDEILRVSKELDLLILEYYREEGYYDENFYR